MRVLSNGTSRKRQARKRNTKAHILLTDLFISSFRYNAMDVRLKTDAYETCVNFFRHLNVYNSLPG